MITIENLEELVDSLFEEFDKRSITLPMPIAKESIQLLRLDLVKMVIIDEFFKRNLVRNEKVTIWLEEQKEKN